MHRGGETAWGDGFIPRMNARSRPGIMRALGPSDLFTDEELSISSIIVDARLALEDQDIAAGLRDSGVAMIVDTQAWRYSDVRTWETAWGSLPYAPARPFSAEQSWVRDYVFGDLSAQYGAGCGYLMLPGWFANLESTEVATNVATWTLEAFEEFRRKVALAPAIAWLPVKSGSPDASLAAAKVYAESGAVNAIYAHREKVNGYRDPVDRLKRSVKLMLEVQGLGLPVIAGYFGCIGNTVRALGLTAADCGPSEGQSFDFSESIRVALPPTGRSASRSGPPAVRMWMEELGQTVTARQMKAIRQDRAAFAEIMCRRTCHRFRIGRDSMHIAVHHGMLSLCEAAERQSEFPASMRVDNARRLLTAMKTRIVMMDTVLNEYERTSLRQDHVDVQLALLADASSMHGVA